MELGDDLLGVVGAYATTKVTLSLLVIFSPLRVYGAHFWRQKTLLEARGLVVDEALIEEGVWYPYYLHQNRTYYGDVSRLTKDKDVVVHHDVTFYAHLRVPTRGTYSGARLIEVRRHHGEEGLHVGTKVFTGLPHMRQAISIEEGVVLLDEYGDTWLYRLGKDTLQRHTTGRGIVDMNYGVMLWLLTRDGEVVPTAGTTTLATPKITSFINAFPYASQRVIAITHTGDPVIVTPSWVAPFDTDDVRGIWPLEEGEKLLGGLVTTSLRSIALTSRFESHRIVSAFDRAYSTTDRTLYVMGELEFRVVPGTVKRTQTILPPSSAHTLYVIVDSPAPLKPLAYDIPS